MAKTPLVRERSRVQSSLAAPPFPKKNNLVTGDASDVSERVTTEQNAKTHKKVGEIRVKRSRSGPYAQKKNAVAAGDRNGVKSVSLKSDNFVSDYSAFTPLGAIVLNVVASLAREGGQ